MENINQKRIDSFLLDSVVSNFIGIIILSIIGIEKYTKLGCFIVLGKEFNYGYSFQLLIVVIYFVFFDLFNHGKTLGKLVFSIFVVNNITLKRLSTIKLLERTFFKMISISIIPISILIFLIKDGYTIQDEIVKSKTIM